MMIDGEIERFPPHIYFVDCQGDGAAQFGVVKTVVVVVRFKRQSLIWNLGKGLVLIQANGPPPLCASRKLFLPTVAFADTPVCYGFACLAAVAERDGDIVLAAMINRQGRPGYYLRRRRGVSIN